MKHERIEKYSIGNIDQHKQGLKSFVVYALYVIIFVVIIVWQFWLTETYENTHIKKIIETTEMELPNRYHTRDNSLYGFERRELK